MGVRDHVDQFAGHQAADLGQHVDQHRVLHYIPVVGGQHVLAPLVQNGVEDIPGDVEGHGPGAGVQIHLMEILVVVKTGEDAAGGGVVLQVIQHPVHLVHLPFGILVLDGELIAIGLADGAVRIRPLIPDVAVQVVDVVGLLLPDPQQFVHRGLPVGPAEGQDGELLLKVIAVDDPEFFHSVGGSTVLPMGTDGQVCVPDPVVQNVPAVLQKERIGTAHGGPSSALGIFFSIANPGEKHNRQMKPRPPNWGRLFLCLL